CMVPHCNVESVVSYKMSGRMDEILAGSPEHAKELLQAEGLNYFLFSAQHRLLDMLPYSRLFSPENIQKYFGIAWTDRTNYLLTWASSSTQPLDDDFLTVYETRLAEPESPWFRFRELIPNLEPATAALRSAHPDLARAFPWRAPPLKGIDIVDATYGE